jgi:hypothetical protein
LAAAEDVRARLRRTRAGEPLPRPLVEQGDFERDLGVADVVGVDGRTGVSVVIVVRGGELVRLVFER